MNNGPTISIGSTGRDVRRLQRIFVMMKVLAPGNITGTFDSTTDQAVKDFQQGAGLTVDGIVGPITWQALPADPNTPLLARGASGSVVTALQRVSRNIQLLRLIRALWMVTLGRKPKPLSKSTNRIGVSKRTESSATRRGGLPREPRVLLSPLFPDLRRFESRAETLRTICMGRRLVAINDDDAPAFARRYSETAAAPADFIQATRLPLQRTR